MEQLALAGATLVADCILQSSRPLARGRRTASLALWLFSVVWWSLSTRSWRKLYSGHLVHAYIWHTHRQKYGLTAEHCQHSEQIYTKIYQAGSSKCWMCIPASLNLKKKNIQNWWSLPSLTIKSFVPKMSWWETQKHFIVSWLVQNLKVQFEIYSFF